MLTFIFVKICAKEQIFGQISLTSHGFYFSVTRCSRPISACNGRDIDANPEKNIILKVTFSTHPSSAKKIIRGIREIRA